MSANSFPLTSVGISQERRTRTPVIPTKLPSGEGGYFTDAPSYTVPSLLTNPTTISPSIFGSGAIYIDPNSDDTIPLGTTIRHEAVHQILASKFPDTARKAAINSKGYAELAQQIKQSRGGQMPDEVPAYAIAPDPSLGLPESIRNSYVGDLINRLSKLDPKAVLNLQKLAAAGSPQQ